MTDVFLSYKAEDRARIAPLVEALEADGLSVWWDAHIGGGDQWRETIERHLESARCVIVAWSKASAGPNGQFVRDEASRAQRRGVYLPVRLDKSDPPLGFGETQALGLQGWKGDRDDPRYVAVLTAVRARLGLAGKRPAAEPRDAKGLSRRTVVAGGAVAAAAATGTGAWFLTRPAAASAASIAVLPFANLSGDPEQAYFSDGIAEELRSALSRIDGLQVVARTSSEIVRDEDAKTASKKLGVANILTGSVRRSPSVIRVSAQLVDGAAGTERWSEIYDRAPGDALLIQTDIANRVADALSLRLAGGANRRAKAGGTTHADAQDVLLKAQAYVRDHDGAEALQRGLGLVDAALALDPSYGDAFAIKAQMLTTRAGTYSTNAAEYRHNYGLAAQAARRAIEIAPQSRLGYWASAVILDQQLDRRAALRQYEKMLSVPGEDGPTLPDFAVFLSEIGRSRPALAMVDRAIAADPLNERSYGWKAEILGNDRRFAEAAKAAERAIQLAPARKWARGFHAYCQMMLGNNAQAKREFDAIGQRFTAPTYQAVLAVRQGDAARIEEYLAFFGKYGDGAHYQFAQVYAQQRKTDDAIAALAKAWTIRDPGLTRILVDALLDPVRGDSRFKALVERLDFPT